MATKKRAVKKPGASRAPAKKPTPVKAVTFTVPPHKTGEDYAGVIVAAGKPTHHVFLLPGELAAANFKDAQAWAVKQGGDLPTRAEQSLLFANLRDKFQSRYYWSGEQCRANSDYAWVQDFGLGGQDYVRKYDEFPVRAVRRVPIQ